MARIPQATTPHDAQPAFGLGGTARGGRWGWCIGLSGVGLVGFFAVCAMDRPMWLLTREVRILPNDLQFMAKAAGYLLTWVIVAAAMFMIDWPLRRTRGWMVALTRGCMVLFGPALAGLVSELLKIVLRRQRPPNPTFDPTTWDGSYLHRPFSDDLFSTHDLSLPSGHAAVAFGAAWMLCWMYPRAAPVWLLLAAGCAAERVMTHAHIFSEVYLSMVVAAPVTYCLWRFNCMLRRRCDRALQTGGASVP